MPTRTQPKTADPDDIDITIARKVRGIIAEHLQTQEDLYRALGVSRRTLQRRLRATEPWSAAEVVQICRHFGVPISAVIPEHLTGGGRA